MSTGIAIVGMACEYPNAKSPRELWELALSKRRVFRNIPNNRLNLNDYYSSDKRDVDKTYSKKAALINNYNFDRIKFKISGKTFRSTDLTHWLALDVASRALNDAGFVNGEGIPKDRGGVLIGNSLTGEFTRANLMRLRWPYVQRVLETTLKKDSSFSEKLNEVLLAIKEEYLKPFPEVNEDTLAGGLSNTIAGRICNYYDFKGGGFTLDGACSSSLLAISNACSALEKKELDLAVVGGVDLSIDPFEIIGFAKNGALAEDNMLVYDQMSNGFWPGEGCGFVVLMREEDAFLRNIKPYSIIKGWGISSDGKGGITRPEIDGQALALERAYKKANYDLNSVSYIEGHGTGTKVGDETELRTLLKMKEGDHNTTYISSIKANIGHTKAASGIAGLIKAVMALNEKIIPAATACNAPHPLINAIDSNVKITKDPIIWPDNKPLRASVSSMGFGGINTHITIEKNDKEKPKYKFSHNERKKIRTYQDVEVFIFSDNNKAVLASKLEKMISELELISLSEFIDLSIQTQKNGNEKETHRVAIIARNPEELQNKLKFVLKMVETEETVLGMGKGIYYFNGKEREGKVAFAFPGQGSPIAPKAGYISKFFPSLELKDINAELVDTARGNTEIAQPLIAQASVLGTKFLDKMGVNADIVLGHSLGEFSALYCADALNEKNLMSIVKKRGELMQHTQSGVMVSTNAPLKLLKQLRKNYKFDIAAINSSNQIVIAGEWKNINVVTEILKEKNYINQQLKVTKGFHSRLMEPIVSDFSILLDKIQFQKPNKPIISTVSGALIKENSKLRKLLVNQLVKPVLFEQAINKIKDEVDLFIEIGAGNTLSPIINEITKVPSTSLNIGDETGISALNVLAASYTLGKKINWELLYKRRNYQVYSGQKQFFESPCEQIECSTNILDDKSQNGDKEKLEVELENSSETIKVIKEVISKKTELPSEAINNNYKMLDDLHLNSISVSQIIVEISRVLNIPPPVSPTDFANATIEEIKDYLDGQKQQDNTVMEEINGIDSWVRPFTVEWKSKKLEKSTIKKGEGDWTILSKDKQMVNLLMSELNKRNIGSGLVIHQSNEIDFQLLEQALTDIKNRKEKLGRVVVLSGVDGISSFWKSFYLENPEITVCLIKIANDSISYTEVIDEISASDGFIEARYISKTRRQVPFLKALEYKVDSNLINLDKKDVILVTGGGKGIGAECAKALSKLTGSKLAILGRSTPTQNKELAENLNQLLRNNIEFSYISVDITDQKKVKKAISEIQNKIGKITGIIHAAGVNHPKLVNQLSIKDIQDTISPKVTGLKNILSEVTNKDLKMLITFGSIIGESGMQGDSHYGFANELLRIVTEEFSIANPHCKSLCLEWSVWEGTGMGEKIGTIDYLKRQGIIPINLDNGINMFLDLVQSDIKKTGVIVSSRMGTLPTMPFNSNKDQFLGRFLENKLIEYPGVELISEVELHYDQDQYLNEHEINNEKLFPAVMMIEAFSQVSNSILGKKDQMPIFKELKFNYPITVDNIGTKIRISGLVIGKNKVKLSIRSEKTNYLLDHVTGICQYVSGNRISPLIHIDNESKHNILTPNPSEALYENTLFQKGRFKNIVGYKFVTALNSISLVENTQYKNWFGKYLPQNLITKSIGPRDSFLHSLQACFPHKHLIPVSVGSVRINKNIDQHEYLIVTGIEKNKNDDLLEYDLQVTSEDGTVLETWKGLLLKTIGEELPIKEWNPYLLGAFLERKINESEKNLNIRVFLDKTIKKIDNSMYAKQVVSNFAPILKRSDNKPETDEIKVSCSKVDNLVLAASSNKDIGCDIAIVENLRWEGLLGQKYFRLAKYLSDEKGESLEISATMAWTVMESLKKSGKLYNHPVTISSINENFVVFNSDNTLIYSYLANVYDEDESFIITLAMEV